MKTAHKASGRGIPRERLHGGVIAAPGLGGSGRALALIKDWLFGFILICLLVDFPIRSVVYAYSSFREGGCTVGNTSPSGI